MKKQRSCLSVFLSKAVFSWHTTKEAFHEAHAKKVDIFVIGFALFSMFFGAGNVIFPPISVWSPVPNGCWVLSATISLISALRWRPCLPFSTAAALRALHAGSGGFLHTADVCHRAIIGPMLAIPRTAASTYEMSVCPLIAGVSPVLFSALFFALILLLYPAVRRGRHCGKNPHSRPADRPADSDRYGDCEPHWSHLHHHTGGQCPHQTGIEAGYQTMDVRPPWYSASSF